MFSSNNVILEEEFKTLSNQRWHKIFTNDDTTKVDYKLLCDVDTILGLSYVVPMLEVVQGLSKYTQN